MARIRTIKPDFFRHERLFEAEKETRLPLRVAFSGLWTAADREGRFHWRPRQLKLDCLPYDEVDFSRVLDALATRGFIEKYAIGSDVFGQIPSWLEHQFINNKEPPSSIPKPEDNQIVDACATRDPPVIDALVTRGVKEGKGKEGERKGKGKDNDASPTAPSDVSPQVFADWAKQRRTLKAAVTDTAIEELRKEAGKARLTLEQAMRMQCQKGWRSFEAKWVGKNNRGPPGVEQRNAEHGEEWLRRHGQSTNEPEIFDAIATERQS